MATPFVEQILDSVVTALTGLTTTGTNVQRGRVYPVSPSVNAALTVFMGDDSVVSILGNEKIEWRLSVLINSHARATSDVDQTLNTIRKEVHAALMADYTLGLSFVTDTEPASASEPELSGDGDQPIATQRLEYIVQYRTSRTALDA